MQFSVKGNKNYCATIVEISNLIELEGCSNIQGTTIFGNHVIISKDTEIGQIGIYFPVECSIKDIFLKVNNLYRDKTLNEDQTKSGFFELNGRVRCMKLRGFKSEGFFIPLESLFSIIPEKDKWQFTDLPDHDKIGIEFDHIDDIMICEKYVVKSKEQKQQNSKKDKKNKKIKRFSKLIDDQFRFHIDTQQFGKNLHKFKLEDYISISEKIHGTSAISSYILCNKKPTLKDKIAKLFKINIVDKDYDYVYSSRRVIKNQYLCDNPSGFYSEDIWKSGHEKLQPFLTKGMTVYYEIAGFLKNGNAIQKMGKYVYDYGCKDKEHKIYIYRITFTDSDGKVFEWSMKQVQDWCKEKGFNAVPLHYYGTVEDFIKNHINIIANDYSLISDNNNLDVFYRIIQDDRDYQEVFSKIITSIYLEKNCFICDNKVPNEGVCIRKEINDIEVYKAKSFAFKNAETQSLDSGEINIEDNQESE